jgi:myo-inositol 2-dehydrogenase/D-chiro-inositol 1-dehydrogenase
MKEKLRIGIIGCGRIGRVHAESIRTRVEGAEVVALADPFMNEEMENWCHGMGIERTSTNSLDIINAKDIDAVLICSPTPTHSPLIKAAAEVGKDIFCEKPIDTDLKRINETMDVVRNCGVKFQIGFNRRFDHNHMAVQEAVNNNTIGKVHIVKVTSRDPEPPKPEYVAVSGGIFLDMMIHDFDMVRYLSNQEVVEVNAIGAVLIDPEIGKAGDVDTAIVTLKMSDGTLAVIDNSRQAVYGYDQRTEVFGEKGCASVENDAKSLVRVSTKNGVESEKPLYFFLDRYMDSYAREISDFVDSAINDKPTLCGIDDAIRPVEIALAATKSLKEGRSVKISEIALS